MGFTYLFRYERPHSRVGPYRASNSKSTDKMISAHNKSNSQRPGWEDFGLGCSEADKVIDNRPFACPSVKALSHWFSGYNKMLSREGYVVAKYKAYDGHVTFGASGKQAVFDMETSERVEEYKDIREALRKNKKQ